MGEKSLVPLSKDVNALTLENYKVGTTFNFTAGYTF